jgi:hypothetical protein
MSLDCNSVCNNLNKFRGPLSAGGLHVVRHGQGLQGVFQDFNPQTRAGQLSGHATFMKDHGLGHHIPDQKIGGEGALYIR